jgi:hypothetical protein
MELFVIYFGQILLIKENLGSGLLQGVPVFVGARISVISSIIEII